MNTEPPKDRFEQLSYDLNKFNERRIADRRATPRGTPDRRLARASTDSAANAGQQAPGADRNGH